MTVKNEGFVKCLSNPELPYWLALLRVPGIGPIKFLQLKQQFPQLAELFQATTRQLEGLGFTGEMLRNIQQPDWHMVERDLMWAEQSSNYIITWKDPNYPPLLRETVGAPPLLYVQGNITLLAAPQLAIVGSRNPTPTGLDTAYYFAASLANRDLTITSGLALGIDAACHRGALAAFGSTIAVLGSGLNSIYPSKHKELAQQIIEQGLLVSELAPDTKVQAANFPRRNRIISGLSLGVLVVEANAKSGSLITARHAVEQGREVFAIPGSIHNPLSKGCHMLIRQGAKLVETESDILEELSPLLKIKEPSIAKIMPYKTQLDGLGQEQRQILHCMGDETSTVDLLVIRSGLTAQAVSSILLLLELQGLVSAVPGGYLKKQLLNL